MKPSIRRRRALSGELAEGWLLTRPAYGFGSTSVSTYPSFREALRALLDDAPASGSQITSLQVAGYVPGLRSWRGAPAIRPRWIEASS
ncbi:MAG TPA: hypothetical protein VGX25_06740 [Actinophytocola sp.]|uniref:hypothetical protein n=1 Tax=Actinophytocola sp. TaxID=1872138 RepID=UPI002DDD930E|nr:hypothetical protein [Actinophytocola sp.]HEV2779085.1 hypothetical protein [Actinophytocola sp.]